ncbi:unnamed protein product [Closterium sp. Naga37s-1]|nr:unnamed protein product [Closterium sp. Naga37s-1]
MHVRIWAFQLRGDTPLAEIPSSSPSQQPLAQTASCTPASSSSPYCRLLPLLLTAVLLRSSLPLHPSNPPSGCRSPHHTSAAMPSAAAAVQCSFAFNQLLPVSPFSCCPHPLHLPPPPLPSLPSPPSPSPPSQAPPHPPLHRPLLPLLLLSPPLLPSLCLHPTKPLFSSVASAPPPSPLPPRPFFPPFPLPGSSPSSSPPPSAASSPSPSSFLSNSSPSPSSAALLLLPVRPKTFPPGAWTLFPTSTAMCSASTGEGVMCNICFLSPSAALLAPKPLKTFPPPFSVVSNLKVEGRSLLIYGYVQRKYW